MRHGSERFAGQVLDKTGGNRLTVADPLSSCVVPSCYPTHLSLIGIGATIPHIYTFHHDPLTPRRFRYCPEKRFPESASRTIFSGGGVPGFMTNCWRSRRPCVTRREAPEGACDVRYPNSLMRRCRRVECAVWGVECAVWEAAVRVFARLALTGMAVGSSDARPVAAGRWLSVSRRHRRAHGAVVPMVPFAFRARHRRAQCRSTRWPSR